MKLRIVTPTLGRSPWLAETLASTGMLAAHGERIVVAPIDQCVPLANLRENMSVLAQSSEGLYGALNDGFRAPGNWTIGTWINDDDRVVLPGFRAALTMLEREAGLAAVFGRVSLISSNGRYIAEIPVAHSVSDLGPLLAAGIVPLAQPGTIFRRDVFERLGGFTESLRAVGDMEFFRRALSSGFRFGFVDAVVAEFRVHRGQISQENDTRHRETALLVSAAQAVPEWILQARAARWRFRWDNRKLYIDRLRRHGIVSMERLSTYE